MPDHPRWLAVIRVIFEAEDEVEANLVSNAMTEALAEHVLEDDDQCDVTQVLPEGGSGSPEEMVQQLRRSRDLLILTRTMQGFDLARELDKVAYVFEHRLEDDFSLASYDWGSFIERTNELLGRKAI